MLSAVADLPIDAHIAQSPLQGRSQRRARDRCLTELVRSLIAMGVTDLIIESCEQGRQDRVVIARTLRDLVSALTCRDRRPNEEVLLRLPAPAGEPHR